jgi:hypothetical protein
LKKGETCYYEIVGYVSENIPIMNKCSNEKMDKEFIKQYGKETIFSYGCLPGQFDIYVYRMSLTNEDGYEIDYDWEYVKTRCEEMNIKKVLQLDKFIYDGNEEKLKEKVEKLVIGTDPIGKTHIKEGIVLRVDGNKWKAYKHKSQEFKILEGILKTNDEIEDIEEEGE